LAACEHEGRCRWEKCRPNRANLTFVYRFLMQYLNNLTMSHLEQNSKPNA
jgi:hypothetical protein